MHRATVAAAQHIHQQLFCTSLAGGVFVRLPSKVPQLSRPMLERCARESGEQPRQLYNYTTELLSRALVSAPFVAMFWYHLALSNMLITYSGKNQNKEYITLIPVSVQLRIIAASAEMSSLTQFRCQPLLGCAVAVPTY